MFKNGDVVFFKSAKKGSDRKALEGRFKGYGFGVLLGHVPPFQKDPPASELLRLMGSIGFISFDDVAEFFGNETGAQCVTKFEDKYYGKVIFQLGPDGKPLLDEKGQPIPLERPPEEVKTEAPSAILGADGNPVN